MLCYTEGREARGWIESEKSGRHAGFGEQEGWLGARSTEGEAMPLSSSGHRSSEGDMMVHGLLGRLDAAGRRARRPKAGRSTTSARTS